MHMFERSLKSSQDNLPETTPHRPLPPPHTPRLATAPYCFHSAAGQRSRLRCKYCFLITVLILQKIKIPPWYCLEDKVVLLFDTYFAFESGFRWHSWLIITVESTRGIRTLVAVFESLEEMFAWGCRNGKFNEQFQILPLELKAKAHFECFRMYFWRF